MLSKLSRNLSNVISWSLGLQIHLNINMVKADLTHSTRDKARRAKLEITSASKGNEKSKKDTEKWCEFQRSPWHNTDECRSKQSLLAEIKEKELDPNSYSNLEHDKGKQIIDVEPCATIETTNTHLDESEDIEEVGHLLHS
jgi:hypothetical protein